LFGHKKEFLYGAKKYHKKKQECSRQGRDVLLVYITMWLKDKTKKL
jgi:hypothetical protein